MQPWGALVETVTLRLLAGGAAEPIDLGTVRRWSAMSVDVNDVFVPARVAGSAWTLPVGRRGEPELTVTFEGETRTGPLYLEAASPPVTFMEIEALGGVTVVFQGLADVAGGGGADDVFEFRSSEAGDRLRVETASASYAADLGHTSPADPLDLGVPAPDTYRLQVGPVVLVNEADPAQTVTVSFQLVWDLGVVARPLAAR